MSTEPVNVNRLKVFPVNIDMTDVRKSYSLTGAILLKVTGAKLTNGENLYSSAPGYSLLYGTHRYSCMYNGSKASPQYGYTCHTPVNISQLILHRFICMMTGREWKAVCDCVLSVTRNPSAKVNRILYVGENDANICSVFGSRLLPGSRETSAKRILWELNVPTVIM